MNSVYDNLKRVFHEPKRLAIVSELCTQPNGLSFPQLKEKCELTDGNLNRHLKMLAEEEIVHIEKKARGSKGKTMVFLTKSGRARFIEYLGALEEVLQNAARATGMAAGEETSENGGIFPALG